MGFLRQPLQAVLEMTIFVGHVEIGQLPNNCATQIIAILLWVALVLWLLIGKPAFWEGHIALKVVCDILCALVVIGMLPKDKKEDDEKKDEK